MKKYLPTFFGAETKLIFLSADANNNEADKFAKAAEAKDEKINEDSDDFDEKDFQDKMAEINNNINAITNPDAKLVANNMLNNEFKKLNDEINNEKLTTLEQLKQITDKAEYFLDTILPYKEKLGAITSEVINKINEKYQTPEEKRTAMDIAVSLNDPQILKLFGEIPVTEIKTRADTIVKLKNYTGNSYDYFVEENLKNVIEELYKPDLNLDQKISTDISGTKGTEKVKTNWFFKDEISYAELISRVIGNSENVAQLLKKEVNNNENSLEKSEIDQKQKLETYLNSFENIHSDSDYKPKLIEIHQLLDQNKIDDATNELDSFLKKEFSGLSVNLTNDKLFAESLRALGDTKTAGEILRKAGAEKVGKEKTTYVPKDKPVIYETYESYGEDGKSSNKIDKTETSTTVEQEIEKNMKSFENRANEHIDKLYEETIKSLEGTSQQFEMIRNEDKVKENMLAMYLLEAGIDKYIKENGSDNLPEELKIYDEMKGLNGVFNFSDENRKITQEMAIMLGSMVITAGAGALLTGIGRLAVTTARGMRVAKVADNAGKIAKATNFVKRGANLVATGVEFSGNIVGKMGSITRVLQESGFLVRTGINSFVFTGSQEILNKLPNVNGMPKGTFVKFLEKWANNAVMFATFEGMGLVSGKFISKMKLAETPGLLAKATGLAIESTGDFTAMLALESLNSEEFPDVDSCIEAAEMAIAFRLGFKTFEKMYPKIVSKIPDKIKQKFRNGEEVKVAEGAGAKIEGTATAETRAVEPVTAKSEVTIATEKAPIKTTSSEPAKIEFKNNDTSINNFKEGKLSAENQKTLLSEYESAKNQLNAFEKKLAKMEEGSQKATVAENTQAQRESLKDMEKRMEEQGVKIPKEKIIGEPLKKVSENGEKVEIKKDTTAEKTVSESSKDSLNIKEQFNDAGFKKGDLVHYKTSGASEKVFKIESITDEGVQLKEWDLIKNAYKEEGLVVRQSKDINKFLKVEMESPSLSTIKESQNNLVEKMKGMKENSSELKNAKNELRQLQKERKILEKEAKAKEVDNTSTNESKTQTNETLADQRIHIESDSPGFKEKISNAINDLKAKFKDKIPTHEDIINAVKNNPKLSSAIASAGIASVLMPIMDNFYPDKAEAGENSSNSNEQSESNSENEKLIDIDNITSETLRKKLTAIDLDDVKKNYEFNKNVSWKEISQLLADDLGVKLNSSNEADLIKFGKKIQVIVASKESDGKTGVKTMTDIAEFLKNK